MRTNKLSILAVGLLLVAALGFGCTTTQSATQATPAKAAAADAWRFHDIVDVKFVQQYARMPRPDKVLIIDSRSRRAKYDKGYIPTAVSIPDSQFAKMTDQLPADKDTLLIFYCQGPT